MLNTAKKKPDTLEEMDAAREDRYWDGLACACEDRAFGASYLFGYAIEMALKVALFRFRHVMPMADLRPELTRVRLMAKTRGVRNLHDLSFWAETLLAERLGSGLPLDPISAGILRAEVGAAAYHWSEVLRYRRSVAADRECEELRGAYEEIVSLYPQLWS
ncbi:MAG: hypothetical protein V2A79_05420 [Planctomycetota bacterium]